MCHDIFLWNKYYLKHCKEIALRGKIMKEKKSRHAGSNISAEGTDILFSVSWNIPCYSHTFRKKFTQWYSWMKLAIMKNLKLQGTVCLQGRYVRKLWWSCCFHGLRQLRQEVHRAEICQNLPVVLHTAKVPVCWSWMPHWSLMTDRKHTATKEERHL